jgi:hypothetical protein
MVSAILKLLKIRFLPKNRRLYVVLEGKYKGEWLLLIKSTEKEDTYFSLPDKYIRVIPKTEFVWGLSRKVLEVVDVLPKSVYNVCLAEYNYTATDEQRNNTINRRE